MRRILGPVIAALLVSVYGCKKDDGGDGGGGEPSAEVPPDGGDGGDDSGTQKDPGGDGGSTDGGTDGDGSSLNKAADAESAETTVPAENLVLSPNFSIVPSKAGSLALTDGFSLAEGTDLENFKASTFMWDPSQEAINQTNYILCVISKTGYNLQANKGPYLAKVSGEACERKDGGGAGSPGGGQGGAKKDKTITFTVGSQQKVINAGKGIFGPLVAKFWFTIKANRGDGMESETMMCPDCPEPKDRKMYAKLVIAEAPNDNNPYGIFTFRWQGFGADSDGTEDATASNLGVIRVTRPDLLGAALTTQAPAGIDRMRFTYWEKDSDEWGGNITNRAEALMEIDPTGESLAEKVIGGTAVTEVIDGEPAVDQG